MWPLWSIHSGRTTSRCVSNGAARSLTVVGRGRRRSASGYARPTRTPPDPPAPPPPRGKPPQQRRRGVGPAGPPAVRQHELHGTQALALFPLRKPLLADRRATRKDLELTTGVRTPHEPQRALPAYRTLRVIDQR